VGIVGETGSGKTALALSLLGLIDPPGQIVAGRVSIGGESVDIHDDRRMQRVRGKRIALVYQDAMNALDPVRSIGAQLAEAIGVHQSNLKPAALRKRVVDLLNDVEIPNAERRLGAYPHEFSGGMRQRVLIAMALANEPEIVVADEPTTALDVTTQVQVLALLDRLVTDRHAAVILITHNLAIVAGFCDTVNVMYAGRIVEKAASSDLFRRPVHPYTSALLRSVPTAQAKTKRRLPTIGGAPPDLAQLQTGCAFAPRCPSADRICAAAPPPIVWDDQSSAFAECHFAGKFRDENV
jgi:oligopeptide/dipeptide ABC transporter ATP-binding protein